MAETTQSSGQRDRSPGYPIVPLQTALERLAQFEAHFKRSAARPEKAGDAWGIKAKSYADRTMAALRYFGLLEYQMIGNDRHIVISEDGRKYLRAQQESTKRDAVKAAALRPKQIAKFWGEWGSERPADGACLDELMDKHGFSEGGAREFLKVYDATITFAGLSDSDKIQPIEGEIPDEGEDEGDSTDGNDDLPPPSGRQKEVKIMPGERELMTGLLSKDARFRLIVHGDIGVKEIDRLIKKLELDKEILEAGEGLAQNWSGDDNKHDDAKG